MHLGPPTARRGVMHESDRSTVRNGGYDLRCVEAPFVIRTFSCIDCRGATLIYNACFGANSPCVMRAAFRCHRSSFPRSKSVGSFPISGAPSGENRQRVYPRGTSHVQASFL